MVDGRVVVVVEGRTVAFVDGRRVVVDDGRMVVVEDGRTVAFVDGRTVVVVDGRYPLLCGTVCIVDCLNVPLDELPFRTGLAPCTVDPDVCAGLSVELLVEPTPGVVTEGRVPDTPGFTAC